MSGEKAGALRGCPLDVQTTNKKDRVSRNTRNRGLANVNSDLANFLGEGRDKRDQEGRASGSAGRPTASQWDSHTLALRSSVAKCGSLFSQVGVSEDGIVRGIHHV